MKLLLFLGFNLSNLFCQSYTAHKKNSEYTIFVELLDNNQYIIKSTNVESGISFFYEISYGSFNKSNDTILFKDEMFDYKFSGSIKKGILKINNGIEYLAGRNFKYSETRIFEPENSIKTIYSLRQEKERNRPLIDSLKTISYVTSIKIGVYSLQAKYGKIWHDLDKYKLEINENHKYKLYIHYDYLLFSEGEWEQINHLLVLKDEKTNAEFMLEIKNNNILKSILIPAIVGQASNFNLRLNNDKQINTPKNKN